VGQATLAAMSSIRAVEAQIAHDVKHLDTNGFLVIRQRYYAPNWQTGVQYEPGDEVYDPSSDKFFLCLTANIAQTSAANSLPGGPTYDNTTWQNLTPGTVGQYPVWRTDQISFIETGTFHSRTGSVQPFTSPSNETTGSFLTSHKALVWLGQFSTSYGAAGLNFTGGSPPAVAGGLGGVDQFEKPYWPQQAWVPLGTPPSGQTSGEYYFGREAMLLIPAGAPTLGSSVYNNPFYPLSAGSAATDGSGTQNGGSDGYPENVASASSGSASSYGTESTYATVTSSRLDATYDELPSSYTLTTPAPSSQSLPSPSGAGTIEGYIDSLPLTATSLYDIPNFLCYRFSTLIAPSASELGYSGTTPPSTATAVLRQQLNGYFRMTPIMLQGVPSFAVDWTDGATWVPTSGGGAPQLVWYGMDGTPAGGTVTPATDGTYLPLYSGDAGAKTLPNDEAVYGNSDYSGTTTADGVTYVFYAGNKPAWPKALKITYLVTDPNNRLQGGRFVTQVVELPQ
jgi:hypothetical protein